MLGAGLFIAALYGDNPTGQLYPGSNLWYLQRLNELQEARREYLSHWRELAKLFAPRRLRYLDEAAGDAQRMGGNLNYALIDNTPLLATQTSTAGLQSGVSSPAQRWFSLDIADDRASKAAREWMDVVLEECYDALRAGGFYDTNHDIYTDMLVFGTTALLPHMDAQTLVRFEPLQPGEYCIAMNNKQLVDTIYRSWSMTARAVEQAYVRSLPTQNERNAAYNRLSRYTKQLLDSNNSEARVELIAACHPLEDEGFKPNPTGLWKHTVFEAIQTSLDAPVLHTGWFDSFPAFVARWELSPPDAYGRSPAMNALGDARQLQVQQQVIHEALRQLVDPPSNLPESFRQHGGNPKRGYSNEHGSQNYGNVTKDMVPAGPAFQIRPQVQDMSYSVEDARMRIRAALYSNLFAAITDLTRREITAQEILAREEERLLVLGPPLERLDRELLRPLIYWLLRVVVNSGRVPPPPDEILGGEGKVKLKYRNIVAQAQRLRSVNDIRMVMATGAQLAAIPQASDALAVLDWGAAMREILQQRDIPEDVIRSESEVEEMAQAQAQMQAQQQQAMLAEQQGKAQKLQAEARSIQEGV